MTIFETIFTGDKLFEIIKENPGSRISELSRLLGCMSNQTTKRLLDRLIDQGKIKKIQRNHGVKALFTYEVL